MPFGMLVSHLQVGTEEWTLPSVRSAASALRLEYVSRFCFFVPSASRSFRATPCFRRWTRCQSRTSPGPQKSCSRSRTRALTSGTMFLHPVKSHMEDVQRLRPLHFCMGIDTSKNFRTQPCISSLHSAQWIFVHPVNRVPER